MASGSDIAILIIILIFTGLLIFSGYELWHFLDNEFGNVGKTFTYCLPPYNLNIKLQVFTDGSFQATWDSSGVQQHNSSGGTGGWSITTSNVPPATPTWIFQDLTDTSIPAVTGNADTSGIFTGCLGQAPVSGHQYQISLTVNPPPGYGCNALPAQTATTSTLSSGGNSNCLTVGWPVLQPILTFNGTTASISWLPPKWQAPDLWSNVFAIIIPGQPSNILVDGSVSGNNQFTPVNFDVGSFAVKGQEYQAIVWSSYNPENDQSPPQYSPIVRY